MIPLPPRTLLYRLTFQPLGDMLSDILETFTAGVSTDAADLGMKLVRPLDDVLGVDLRDEGVLEQWRVFEEGRNLYKHAIRGIRDLFR